MTSRAMNRLSGRLRDRDLHGDVTVCHGLSQVTVASYERCTRSIEMTFPLAGDLTL